MISSPIFLVAAERSGTTLLRLMLDHHPLIAFLPEFEFAVEAVSDEGCWPPLPVFHESLTLRRDFEEYDLRVDSALDYPELVDSFLCQKRDRDHKPMVGATVHRDFARLLHIWPDARFVHLVRDGRDVAPSSIAMGWAGTNWGGIDRWIEAERLWDSLRERVGDRAIDVRYEDLVSSPERVLTKICEFVGVAFDSAMFDYAKTSTYGLPEASLAFQWRRRQSDWQVRLTESRIADRLVAAGYEPSGLPPLRVGPALRFGLQCQDRIARWAFRLRRFGWRLSLESALARRLRVKAWMRSVQLRINSVERSHLR